MLVSIKVSLGVLCSLFSDCFWLIGEVGVLAPDAHARGHMKPVLELFTAGSHALPLSNKGDK